jgi:hypothetical protein
VSHSVLTFPNYVVIGVPVLSAMFTPALVKVYMGLLLMEQVSLHLTGVAVIAEMFCKAPPAPVVGEHAHGAMHLHGPPLRTDAHGWATGVVAAVLSRTGGAAIAPASGGSSGRDDSGSAASGGSRSASRTKATELKPRAGGLVRGASLDGERTAALLGGDAAAPAEHTHATPADDDDGSADVEASNASGRASCWHGPEHVMPEHSNEVLRMLRILRDRLVHNPMVLGAFAVRARMCTCVHVQCSRKSSETRVRVRAGRHHHAGGEGDRPPPQAAVCACSIRAPRARAFGRCQRCRRAHSCAAAASLAAARSWTRRRCT